MLSRIAVDHVEVDPVGSGAVGGPGHGRALGRGALDHAPTRPTVLLPDELVLQARGVAGDLRPQIDGAARLGGGGRVQAVERPALVDVHGGGGVARVGAVDDVEVDGVVAGLLGGPFGLGAGGLAAAHDAPARPAALLPDELVLQARGVARDARRERHGAAGPRAARGAHAVERPTRHFVFNALGDEPFIIYHIYINMIIASFFGNPGCRVAVRLRGNRPPARPVVFLPDELVF